MSLPVVPSFNAPLVLSTSSKATHLNSLDARIIGVGEQIKEHARTATTTSSSNVKVRFINQLFETPATRSIIHDLLEKHYLESSDGSPIESFKSAMLAHITSAMKATAVSGGKDRTDGDQISAMMERLMDKLKPQIALLEEKKAGLAEGTGVDIAVTCANAKREENTILSNLQSALRTNINHRSAASKSKDSSTLVRELASGYTTSLPAATTGRKLFSDLWSFSCISKGKNVDPKEVLNELAQQIAKQLLSEKDYSPEDAAKKAWHIANGLYAESKDLLTDANHAHMEGYLLGLNANPDALEAYHSRDKTSFSHALETFDAMTIVREMPGVAPSKEKIAFDQALDRESAFTTKSSELEGILFANLKKTSGLVSSSYTLTPGKLTPAFMEDFAKQFFLQNTNLSVADLQLHLTQKIMEIFQRQESPLPDDKCLATANQLAQSLSKDAATNLFDRAYTASRADATTIPPAHLEAYKAAKKVYPFIKDPGTDAAAAARIQELEAQLAGAKAKLVPQTTAPSVQLRPRTRPDPATTAEGDPTPASTVARPNLFAAGGAIQAALASRAARAPSVSSDPTPTDGTSPPPATENRRPPNAFAARSNPFGGDGLEQLKARAAAKSAANAAKAPEESTTASAGASVAAAVPRAPAINPGMLAGAALRKTPSKSDSASTTSAGSIAAAAPKPTTMAEQALAARLAMQERAAARQAAAAAAAAATDAGATTTASIDEQPKAPTLRRVEPTVSGEKPAASRAAPFGQVRLKPAAPPAGGSSAPTQQASTSTTGELAARLAAARKAAEGNPDQKK